MRGIGRATAVALAEAGLDIGVTWRSDEAGANGIVAEVRKKGGRAEVVHLDTSALTSCGDVIDDLADRLGGVDVFVNNAGTGSGALALEMTIEQWRHVVATDLDGAFACIHAPPAGWSQPAMAARSLRSQVSTSTSRGWDQQPTTQPSTVSAA